MSDHDLRPKWWQLYLTFPLLMVLFLVESRLKISVHGHQAVQIGIILLIYGVVGLWLKANARALSGMDWRQDHGTFTVIQIRPYQLSEKDKHSKFHFPESEIKGVLSNTFEMDYMDAECFPVDEVPQEVDKE